MSLLPSKLPKYVFLLFILIVSSHGLPIPEAPGVDQTARRAATSAGYLLIKELHHDH